MIKAQDQSLLYLLSACHWPREIERERERERGREGGLIWRRKESRCTHTIGYPVAANLLRRHRPRRFVLPASAAPSRGGLPLASSPVGPSPNVLLGSSYRYSSVARGFSSSLPSSTSPACCFTWVPSPSTSFPSSSTARLPALSTGARRFTPSSAPKWILINRPAIRSVLGPILVFFLAEILSFWSGFDPFLFDSDLGHFLNWWDCDLDIKGN